MVRNERIGRGIKLLALKISENFLVVPEVLGQTQMIHGVSPTHPESDICKGLKQKNNGNREGT